MKRVLLAISLAMEILPYVTRAIAVIETISSDPETQKRLRDRAKELAFESAESFLVRLENELHV